MLSKHMLISKRRWVHALSYEVILLVIIALALSYVFEMPMQVTGGLRHCNGGDFGAVEYAV